MSLNMGSCEGVQVLGLLQTAQDGKQMILQFKPSSKIPWEICRFCDAKWDSDSDIQSKRTEHLHPIKGIFSFLPNENQWTLTFTNSDKNEDQNTCMKSANEITIENDSSQQKRTQSSLQYEVDGKVYELRNNLPARNKSYIEPSKSNTFSQNKPKLRTKAIEFVIENQKYSTSSISAKHFDSNNVIGEERSALEASLEQLQVDFLNCKIFKLLFLKL